MWRIDRRLEGREGERRRIDVKIGAIYWHVSDVFVSGCDKSG